jgi:hypothetical protein
MQMHISCLQKKLCLFGYMYELLHFLNFTHGLMVHVNAYFVCFMDKHNIFEDLYLCRMFFKMFIYFLKFTFSIVVYNFSFPY